jgi:hypothetical protein
MADAVDGFYDNPKPSQRDSDRPMASHWPKIAPSSKCHEQHIQGHKPVRMICGHEAGNKARRRE